MKSLFLVFMFLSVAAVASAQSLYYPRVPAIPAPTLVAPVGPPAVIAADGTYLGRLSSNQFDPQSISNPFGKYGSEFSPTSINNPFGKYGSEFSPLSPNNPFATSPPIRVTPLSTLPYRVW